MFKKLFDSKLFRWIRYIRQQLQNQKQNRQVIGQDRYGNKYYQYYSYWGLPIRRQIRWKNPGDFVLQDLVYYRWLHHQQFDPPTQAEKQQFYLEEKIRFEKALQWDQKQANLLEQFKKKKQQLALRNLALAQLEKQMIANQTLTNIKTKRVPNTQNTHKIETKQSNPSVDPKREQISQDNKH